MNQGRGKSVSRRNKRQTSSNPLNLALSSGDATGYSGCVVQNFVPSTKSVNYRIQRVTLGVEEGYINSSSSADFAAGYSFQAGLVPQFNDYTAVYDSYRIVGIEARFIAITVPPGVLSTPVGTACLIAAVDLDSDTVPVSLGDLLGYDKKQRMMLGPGQSGVFGFRPSPQGALVNSSGVNSPAAIMDSSTWIDCAKDDIEFFGLKVFIDQEPTASVNMWRLMFEYTFEFRCPI
jgi:hypothetical protein